MQLRDKIILGLLLVIAIVTFSHLNTCNTLTELRLAKPKVTLDTIYRDIPPPPNWKPDSVKVKVNVEVPVYIVDTSAMNGLIAQRDSLTALLKDSSVRIAFSADTVNPTTHDTLKIICDEIKRNIEFTLGYAPRQQKEIYRTETFVEEITWWEKVFYGSVGAAIAELLHLVFGK